MVNPPSVQIRRSLDLVMVRKYLRKPLGNRFYPYLLGCPMILQYNPLESDRFALPLVYQRWLEIAACCE
jgi:hypothetical protein